MRRPCFVLGLNLSRSAASSQGVPSRTGPPGTCFPFRSVQLHRLRQHAESRARAHLLQGPHHAAAAGTTAAATRPSASGEVERKQCVMTVLVVPPIRSHDLCGVGSGSTIRFRFPKETANARHLPGSDSRGGGARARGPSVRERAGSGGRQAPGLDQGRGGGGANLRGLGQLPWRADLVPQARQPLSSRHLRSAGKHQANLEFCSPTTIGGSARWSSTSRTAATSATARSTISSTSTPRCCSAPWSATTSSCPIVR